MATILILETATPVCSVALAKDGQLLGFKESEEPNAHSKVLTSFIEDVLKQGGITAKELDAVAVSRGPGSYTGLRIGVSAAKGLCYAIDIPLLSPDTLQAMAWGASKYIDGIQLPDYKADIMFCPMIDARRMEVYCGIWDKNNVPVSEVEAKIIDENSFKEILDEKPMVFFGNGAEKCKEVLGAHSNAYFYDDMTASSAFLIPLAEQLYAARNFENLAYFEPFYLKDFVAGAPKVKGLR
jgi:tRNA threonylcarbamoyladenosine biosynthesis protein TsaB